MFNLGKKPQRPNIMRSLIGDSIKRTVGNEQARNRPQEEEVPLLPRGKRNASISHEMLSQLPIHWRSIWHRLDLETIFAVDEEVIESEIETVSKTPVNVKLLTQDHNLQRQAEKLGHQRDNQYSKEVGL